MGFERFDAPESEREAQLRVAGEKIQEQLQQGKPIDIADLLSPEEGLIADADGPVTLRLVNGTIVHLEGNIVGTQLETEAGSLKNFLNKFDGTFRMCTPEDLGNVIDAYIAHHPDELPKLQRAAEELEKNPDPSLPQNKLPPMFKYIQDR